MKRKMLVSVLLVALLAAGFAVVPASHRVSAECISASGNGDVDVLLGPFNMSAGSSITIVMTAGDRPTIPQSPALQPPVGGTGIDVWVDGVLVVDFDVAYTETHTVNYTLLADGAVVVGLDWEFNGDPANTYTVTSSDCGIGCDALVAIPSQAVMGLFTSNATVYWAPETGAATPLTISAGKTYRVTGQDATGQFRQIILECQFVWVPFNTVGPDPEPLWGSAPLPTTVVK
jgi:hypothetical protein